MSFISAGSKFNIGTDRSITITDNTSGVTVNFGGRLNKFTYSDKDKQVEGQGIDDGGRTYHRNIPGGITGEFTIERARGDLARFKGALDTAFFAGGGQAEFTVVQKTVNSFDNSTDVVKLTHVVFHNYKDGEWDQANKVLPSISFSATEAINL